MKMRLIATAALLLCACAFPLWVTFPLGIFCVVKFERFYEIVPIFFINDVLFGVREARYFHSAYVMTLFAIILVLLSVWLRDRIFQSRSMGHI